MIQLRVGGVVLGYVCFQEIVVSWLYEEIADFSLLGFWVLFRGKEMKIGSQRFWLGRFSCDERWLL